MIKLAFIFGTRPEAIKLAPVIRQAQSNSAEIETITCVTGQHRRMLDQVIRLFELPVDYDLDIMKENQTIFDVTVNALSMTGKVLEKESPDIVLTQGDTTTAFAASLAAFYLKIPVAHVEAGLRTNNKYQPFPEEINRRLTTHIADFHFAPTDGARKNLLKEGISPERIFVTGNTVIDALNIIVARQSEPAARKSWGKKFLQKTGVELNGHRLILVTGHRRENHGQGFNNICGALRQIAARDKNIQIVYPVHLNPNVREPVKGILGGIENIHLIEPLEYDEFVYLMNKSYLVLTDSGGIQEEAPSLGKPVLVMREVTERPEAVEAGTAILVGTDTETIVRETQRLLDDEKAYRKMSLAHNPYGDGRASERIIETLLLESARC